MNTDNSVYKRNIYFPRRIFKRIRPKKLCKNSRAFSVKQDAADQRTVKIGI